MSELLLVRHAEPSVGSGTPTGEWPLTRRGRVDAKALGETLASRSAVTDVWTSSERKALETAELVAPRITAVVRPELAEVRRPWYPDAGELRAAVSTYFGGGRVEGWETRGEVLDRLAVVRQQLPQVGSVVVVSHGVLLTTWLASEVGLEDPFAFCMSLKMPDAWAVHLGARSLIRV